MHKYQRFFHAVALRSYCYHLTDKIYCVRINTLENTEYYRLRNVIISVGKIFLIPETKFHVTENIYLLCIITIHYRFAHSKQINEERILKQNESSIFFNMFIGQKNVVKYIYTPKACVQWSIMAEKHLEDEIILVTGHDANCVVDF